MPQTIKADNVKIEGRVILGNNAEKTDNGQISENNAANRPPVVKLIESNEQYAVIEIVCGCGMKTKVQCNYAEVDKG